MQLRLFVVFLFLNLGFDCIFFLEVRVLFYFTMCSYIGLFIAMDDTKSHYSDKCHRNITLNALKTLSTKLHHLPKPFIFMYNKFVAIASVLGVFQFIRGPKSVQFCFFLP